MSPGRYTLVIPTFNRPVDLARQLRFLAHQKAAFPVLVLDSSAEEIHQKNRQSAQGLAIDLRIERFDPATPPFEKFWRGAEMVQTEYASLCADDDFVLTAAIQEIVAFLDRNPDAEMTVKVVGHQWYWAY